MIIIKPVVFHLFSSYSGHQAPAPREAVIWINDSQLYVLSLLQLVISRSRQLDHVQVEQKERHRVEDDPKRTITIYLK